MDTRPHARPAAAAGLVPPPPWHYVGDFLVVDFHADPDAAVSLLPEGLEPFAEDPGRCAAVFADWQSFSEGGDELIDPVRGQYKEAYIVVSAATGRRAGDAVHVHLGRSGLRAHPRPHPGVPQEARTGVDDAHLQPGLRRLSAARAPASAFGATCSARGRELVRAKVDARRRSESGSLHTDPPIVNVRYFPRLAAGRHEDPQVNELVRSRSRDRARLGDLGGRRVA